MKLAVSNIAWTPAEDAEVAQCLQELGVKYIEIAPTKVWDDPLTVSDEQIQSYKDFWAKHDIQIVAFQSMLFGRLDLTIFENEATRQKTTEYLNQFIQLAGRVGAEVLVFGSPKNRQVKELPANQVQQIATKFFGTLGDTAINSQTNFCIEPNAPAYECDFVTTAAEGLALVEALDNPGFELHLDAACMTMAGDNPHNSIVNAKTHLRHFHVSAPMLQPIEEQEVNHQAMANALREIDYQHFISVEMRPGDAGQNAGRVRSAVEIAQKYYS